MRNGAAAFLLILFGFFAFPAAAQQVSEGQNRADYLAWLAREPAARAQVLGFKTFLAPKKVDDVVPTWQLLRTASMWRDCSGPRFEVAPVSEWQNVAETLGYVKSHVQPVIGPVQVMSGYRNEGLNQCSGGARASAHRHFYALDLMPAQPVARTELVRSLCAIHQFRGAEYDVGLGFYSGTRFHVDSKGFRRWGPDGRGATSPCVTEV